MTVIDTNDNVSAHLADLKSRGVTAIGRYYSSSSWKRITKQEAANITNAGMDIFVVFEDSGDPTLTADTGIHHAQIAATQAKGIGQPKGSTIYFALEHLPSGYKKKHVKAIKEYIGGVKDVLNEKYRVGVYSDGVVCDALLSSGLCDHAWLSASSSFEGTKDFYESDRWSLAQDSHVDQNWNGLSVDLNEAKNNFGAFKVELNDGLIASPVEPVSPLGAIAIAASDAVPAGFADRIQRIATEQWQFFGRQTYDINGHKDHAGHTEGENGWYQRVGQFWLEGTNTHGVDGRNHESYWSATFISWIMRRAGAGSRFRYSIKHSVFIAQGIRDFLQKRDAASYWTERLADARPAIGDIVCWAREGGVDYDHQKGGDYAGHSDVIVEVGPEQVWIIGGNVGNSVTRRPLRLDESGCILPIFQNGETLFAIMKNRLG